MKILNIEKCPKVGGDGYYWQVTIPKRDGSPSGSPLLEWTEPTYQIGDDVPKEVVLVKPQGGKWYYKWVDGGEAKPKPLEGKKITKDFFKDNELIMLQVAYKGAVELEGYWYVPDGKEHNARVLENTAELYAGLLLMRPNKSKE